MAGRKKGIISTMDETLAALAAENLKLSEEKKEAVNMVNENATKRDVLGNKMIRVQSAISYLNSVRRDYATA